MHATKKKSILLLIAALFFITSGIAYAQCSKGGCEGKPPMHGEKSPQHGPMIPDLTEDQKEKMETIRLELLTEVQPLQNEIGEKAARLRTLQTGIKVNMSEINKVIEDIGQLRTTIMKLKVAHHQEIRSLLTDKQRVFFDAHHPSNKGGPGEHHGPHHGHGPR